MFDWFWKKVRECAAAEVDSKLTTIQRLQDLDFKDLCAEDDKLRAGLVELRSEFNSELNSLAFRACHRQDKHCNCGDTLLAIDAELQALRAEVKKLRPKPKPACKPSRNGVGRGSR